MSIKNIPRGDHLCHACSLSMATPIISFILFHRSVPFCSYISAFIIFSICCGSKSKYDLRIFSTNPAHTIINVHDRWNTLRTLLLVGTKFSDFGEIALNSLIIAPAKFKFGAKFSHIWKSKFKISEHMAAVG